MRGSSNRRSDLRIRPRISLKAAVHKLAVLYPLRDPLADPISILVWENIGYLIDDTRRLALFHEFRRRVGLKPAQIANAPSRALTEIVSRGGMHPQKRAERVRQIGTIAIAECDGDIIGHLRSLPPSKARALLKKFPSVGDPGADRILLFSGVLAQPCLDSNGIRVLVRLGFFEEQRSYPRNYKAAIATLRKQGTANADWLRRAYGSLREHG